MQSNKIVIITAPSGSGKTTVVNALLKIFPQLCFSVSCATRAPRGQEVNGIDYYFITEQAFNENIEAKKFLEWEMVYKGKYYGTLITEVEKIWKNNQTPLLDIDVQGALRVIKKSEELKYKTLSIFIAPPSLQVLEQRLKNRGTETPESLNERIAKAEFELTFAKHFKAHIINDILEQTISETTVLLHEFFN